MPFFYLFFWRLKDLGQFNCVSFAFFLLANIEAVIITASFSIRNGISPKEAVSEYSFRGIRNKYKNSNNLII